MASVTVSRPRTGHPSWRAPNTPAVTSSPVEVGPQAPGRGATYVGVVGRAVARRVVAQTGRCVLPFAGRAAAVAQKVAPQTGRSIVGLTAAANPGISVAGSFTHVTITRDYDLADGAAPTGTVYFTPSGWLLNNQVTLVAATVGAVLDSSGQISISLAANNDPDTEPSDSYYTVREVITGQPERTYKVTIPAGAGLSVDLATLPVIP